MFYRLISACKSWSSGSRLLPLLGQQIFLQCSSCLVCPKNAIFWPILDRNVFLIRLCIENFVQARTKHCCLQIGCSVVVHLIGPDCVFRFEVFRGSSQSTQSIANIASASFQCDQLTTDPIRRKKANAGPQNCGCVGLLLSTNLLYRTEASMLKMPSNLPRHKR